MERLWDMEETKQYFKVKDTRTIIKFIHQGLPCFKIGSKDYRFDRKDIENFVETQKQVTQETLEIKPIKRKVKSKTINVDFQKRKINLEMNRVV